MSLITFFRRPLGGIEMETLIALQEVSWVMPLILTEDAAETVRAFDPYSMHFPGYIFAIPWALAGGMTLIGLWLYFHDNYLCAPLRFAGSTLSAIIWTWVFVRSLILLEGAGPSLGIYFWNAMASLRILYSAWRRPWNNSVL